MWFRFLIVALAVLVFGCMPAMAAEDNEVDELLQDVLEASGGEDAWQQLRSLRVSGTLGIAGELERAAFAIEWRRPMAVRFELVQSAGTVVQAFDGSTGWVMMPGAAEPVRLAPAQVRQLVQQTDLVGPLLRLAMSEGRPEEVNLGDAGTDRAGKDRPELIRVRFLDEQQAAVESLVDAQTFLEVQREWTGLVRGEPVSMRSIFRDHRREGPVTLAHRVEVRNQANGRVNILEIDHVELDVELPDERFSIPEDAGSSESSGQETGAS